MSSVLGLSPANGFYSGQIMSDGSFGYCDTDPQDVRRGTTDYSDPVAHSGSFTSLGNNTWSGNGLKNAGYILSKYGNTTDQKQSVAVHRAVLQSADPGQYDPGSPGGSAQALADQYLADAAANAAAVDTGYSANVVAAPDGRTATVSVSGPAGYPATATINGPAVWMNTNSSGTQFTTGQALPQITATGSGKFTISIHADGLPDTILWNSTSPTSQDLFKAGSTHSSDAVTGDAQLAFDFQPVATSTAGQFVEGGQALTDVLHVNTSTGAANDWVVQNGSSVPATFDVTWYYSPVKLPATADVPASAEPFTTGKATATGPDDITATADKPAGQAGYYYPVAAFIKANQPQELRQYFIGDWKAGFNDPGEQSIVKYQPQVTTKASVIENGKINDVITVTGNEPVKELTVTTDLFLTSEAPVTGGTDAAPADAKLIGTVTTTVIGNGNFNSPALDVPWETIITEKWDKGLAANLYFSEKIQETESTKPWDGKELLPGETVPVEKPSVITKASKNGPVPVVAHDTGVLTGTVPSGTGITVTTLVNQFKFDDSTDGSAQPVCLNPAWTSATQTITAAGDIVYPEHTIENFGTYGYVEELNITIDKGPGKEPFTAQLHKGACGEKTETVIAFPKDIVPAQEKPQLTAISHDSPVAPVANTGDVTAHQGPNLPLLYTGAGVLVFALLVIGGVYWQKRRADKLAAADNSAAGTDGLNS